MKKRPMVLIFAGMLSGTAVVWNEMSRTTAFYLLMSICALTALIYKDRRYCFLIAGILFGIFVSTGSKISMNLDLRQIKKEDCIITGRVLSVSKTKKGKQALLLKEDGLEGKIMVYTKSDKNVRSGDILSFQGVLEEWKEATNPGQFSSRRYYFGKGIYYHAYTKKIEIKGHKTSFFNEMITKCQMYFKHQLNIQYKNEVEEFLNGMMLGDKKELSDQMKDDFKESGLIHLLAVSGLHISLAGRSLYRWIRKFCKSFLLSAFFGSFGAVFYCILTGMSVSSLRALIMLLIYFLSEILGEHYDLLSAASFAGIVLLFLCPYRIYDTGFLYSLTAVFVIGCYQSIEPKMRGNLKKIKESLLFCIFIQIGMLPLMIYFQYETPIFSFLANVIAVPAATMGFTLAFIFIFFPYTICHKMVAYLIEIVLWISRRSYGMLTIGHVPFIWVVVFYGVLFLCVSRKNKIRFKIRIMLLYTGTIFLIFVPLLKEKTITFLDVGQGDCMVADTGAGLIVSDGGSSSEDCVGRYRILPYIKYLGHQKIKIALISHMDQDHYSGILELLNLGRIEYLGLPEIPKDVAMEKIIKAAKEHDTKIFYLSKGKKIQMKDGFLEVIHPQKDSNMEKNAASLVMQGKLLGYKILLTGDVEKEGEEQLLSERLCPIEILKVAHHGSKNSTSDEFLDKISPQYAIISCGENNRYGHPHQEMMYRLKTHHAKILRTDKKGAIIYRKKR